MKKLTLSFLLLCPLMSLALPPFQGFIDMDGTTIALEPSTALLDPSTALPQGAHFPQAVTQTQRYTLDVDKLHNTTFDVIYDLKNTQGDTYECGFRFHVDNHGLVSMLTFPDPARSLWTEERFNCDWSESNFALSIGARPWSTS